MARELPIQVASNEDIISLECNYINKIARILVGVGTLDKENNFIPQPDQVYQVYNFVGDKFDELMNSSINNPNAIISKEDLWPSIDEKRVELEQIKIAEEAVFIKDTKEVVKDVKP